MQETGATVTKYHFSLAAFLAGFNSCFVKWIAMLDFTAEINFLELYNFIPTWECLDDGSKHASRSSTFIGGNLVIITRVLLAWTDDFLNREVKHDVTSNGKRQKWNFCRLCSAVCTVEWKYFYLRWIVGVVCPFLCDLFKDYKKRIKIQRYSLPFAVCRKRHA